MSILEDPEVGEPWMFVKDMYLFVFCCFCYVKYVSTDMLEGQVSEDRDQDLNEDEDIRLDPIREEHWRDVPNEGEDKKKIHAMMW